MSSESMEMNADALDIRLLRFRSRRDESPHALASDLLDASRVTEALEVVHAGLLESEDDAGLLVLEGRAWFEEGDLPQAQAALLRAAKCQPTNSDAYRWLSQVLMKRGEPAKAVKVLERAVRLRPGDAELQRALQRAVRLSRIATQADSGQLSAPEPPASLPPVPESLPRPGKMAAHPAANAAPPAAAKRPPAPGGYRAPGGTLLMTGQSSESLELDVEVEAARKVEAPGDGRLERSTVAMEDPVAPFNEFDQTDADVPIVQDPANGAAPAGARSAGVGLPDPFVDAQSRPSDASLPAAGRSNHGSGSSDEWAEVHSRSVELAEPSTDLTDSDLFDRASVDESVPALETETAGASSEASAWGAEPPVQPGQAEGELSPPSEPEPPERVLNVLEQQGLFEAPGGTEHVWNQGREAMPARTRVRTGLVVAWVLAVLLAGGGYFGWQKWLEHRHAEAGALLEQVRAQLAEGDHAERARAQAVLGRARELHPRLAELDRVATLLHATHALADGELDVSYLRPALARLREAEKDSPIVVLGSGIIALSSNDPAAAANALERANPAQLDDAQARYVAAALALRLGDARAQALLHRAVEAPGATASAQLAAAQDALLAGDTARVSTHLEAAGGADGESLRASLLAGLIAGEGAGAAGSGAPEVSAARVEKAAVTDRVLWELGRARQAFAEGDAPAAKQAVGRAAVVQPRDPQLLALLSHVASDVGAHDVAYASARGALQTAPRNQRYRDELVRALLARGDGEAVARVLRDAPEDAAWAVFARARAALLTRDREALQKAHQQLEGLETESDPRLAALRLRVELAMDYAARGVLARARRLAAEQPQLGEAQRAVGEAALKLQDAKLAVAALERARALLPESGELWLELSQAHGLAGEDRASREALERALEVSPELHEARAKLAAIALAEGDYAEAERRYRTLAKREGQPELVLGHAEALLGLRRLAEAREVLERLPDEARTGAPVQLLVARLALLENDPRAAVALLEPLLEGAARSPESLSLYGDALFARDEVDAAAGAYEAALEIDGKYPEALIGRAHAAVRAEKTRQAHAWLDTAEQSLASRPTPSALRARLLLVRGKARIHDRDFEQAREALHEAVELPGTPAEAYFWYAEALALTKQPGAREQYEKYLIEAPEGELVGRAKRALKPR